MMRLSYAPSYDWEASYNLAFPPPLLADTDQDNRLFEDEEILFEDAPVIAEDEDTDPDPRPLSEILGDLVKPIIERGAILHRFNSDAAIQAYCQENYLENPQVRANGAVVAFCDFHNRYVTIGWIA